MIDAQLQIMRIMYAAFIAAMIIQAYILSVISGTPGTSLDSTILIIFAGVGVMLLISAQSYWRMKLSVVKESISIHPEDVKLCKRWQALFIITLAINEGAFMWGCALFFMGVPIEKAGLLWALHFSVY